MLQSGTGVTRREVLAAGAVPAASHLLGACSEEFAAQQRSRTAVPPSLRSS
jgi:hypothetical protein